MSTFKFKKTYENAVTPTKNLPTDSGYDLTLIKKVKQVGKLEYYSTGICVEPSNGYYFELFPRSSIGKSGYILANSVGVIDYEYRGEIMACLIKFDETVEDLQLPIRLLQLIPKKIIDIEMKEVNELTDTSRGNSGFGSSGK